MLLCGWLPPVLTMLVDCCVGVSLLPCGENIIFGGVPRLLTPKICPVGNAPRPVPAVVDAWIPWLCCGICVTFSMTEVLPLVTPTGYWPPCPVEPRIAGPRKSGGQKVGAPLPP